MSKPNSIEMASNDPVDVANPRYISLVVVEDSLNQRYYNKYNEPPNRERVTSFYSRVLDLDKLNSARKDVFETTGILENILSFLPAKNIFGVRRVSRLWNDIIAASIRLQEKNVSATRQQATGNVDSGRRAQDRRKQFREAILLLEQHGHDISTYQRPSSVARVSH
jgi:hypothetical protein